MSSSGQNPGLDGWGKEIQFVFKWHLQAVSLMLTTQVIEVENVKFRRGETSPGRRLGEEGPSSGWAGTALGLGGPRAASVFMWLLSLSDILGGLRNKRLCRAASRT